MKTRFLKWLTGSMFGLVALSVQAVPMAYVEGTHYFETPEKLPTMDASKVEVVEMFSYTCPHCFKLEGAVEEWEKTLPENVHFVRVPAIFRDSWLELAKVFYAAEALGELDNLHGKLFHAIHVEKKNLSTESSLLDWIEEQGLDRATFEKTMNSFSVQGKVKRALIMSQTSGITGVPSFIVNGRYHTNASHAGTTEDMFGVVNMLIQQEQAK
jgi:thiol:disulfide interchange protein DsbA